MVNTSLANSNLMIQNLRKLPLLAVIALLGPIGLIVPEGAIAQPTSKAKGCLNSRIVTNAGLVRESYRVGNFVLNDGTGSSINVREKPTAKSSIQYAAPSRRGVSIFEQVVGTDGYCWIKVEGQIWDDGNTRPIGTFSGWVRGDLVKMET
jgi:hypothetical protein